jgi:uncharacterized short protein YbdD (DUF466 family)
MQRLKTIWRGIRQLSGDDAYERYLHHYAKYHQNTAETRLTKAEFFKRWQDGLWDGIKRCC